MLVGIVTTIGLLPKDALETGENPAIATEVPLLTAVISEYLSGLPVVAVYGIEKDVAATGTSSI